MRVGHVRSVGLVASLAFVASVAATPTARAQAARETGKAARGGSFKTPWGDPDLQGVWTNTTSTPLERPKDAGAKATLSAEERAARDAAVAAASESTAKRPGDTGAYNSFWMEGGRSSERTSLIVDPPDGRLPALTAEAQKHADAIEAVRRVPPRSWLDVNTYDRCITRGLPGAMMPGFYNHNYRILQTPDYVAILVEMIHEARIIRLGDRAPFGPRNKQWLGDSRGRWEGDTLVVETTNFNNGVDEVTGNAMRFPNGDVIGERYHGVFGTATMTVTERFRRVDANTIDYSFTVNDPKTFVKPWTAVAPMMRQSGSMYEYACHEGNHAIPNMLSGARAQEQDDVRKKSQPQQ